MTEKKKKINETKTKNKPDYQEVSKIFPTEPELHNWFIRRYCN